MTILKRLGLLAAAAGLLTLGACQSSTAGKRTIDVPAPATEPAKAAVEAAPAPAETPAAAPADDTKKN
jgi:hypothetical protein